MRADSCSGPTTDSICGHGLGRMGHSSNFARWPHLGPIPPMDGGGHLVPLSYVYGYRGGVGRRGVAQDTIGDNGLKIRARVRRYQLILSRCAAGFVPKSAISEISRSGQRKNGRSGEKFLSTARPELHKNTANLHCPSSDCNLYASDCNLPHFRRKHSPKCQFHKQVHTHAGHYEGPGPRVPEKKATQFIFTVSKHEIHCTLQPEQA